MKKQAVLPPNPIKFITNISCFKKIIKGFDVTDKESLLDILMYQPKLIHSCMTRGYTMEDADFLKLSCRVYYNIPFVSHAWFGSKKGYSLKSTSNIPISDLNREELSQIINGLDMPTKIKPINLEMRQTVHSIESTFSFKIK